MGITNILHNSKNHFSAAKIIIFRISVYLYISIFESYILIHCPYILSIFSHYGGRSHARETYFASSPGLIAITLPSITATAPLVAAATKSL